jgi:DNA-directed RNA polymerase specialized sigma24 family protein
MHTWYVARAIPIEDLEQEACLQLWLWVNTARDPTHFRCWARRRILNYVSYAMSRQTHGAGTGWRTHKPTRTMSIAEACPSEDVECWQPMGTPAQAESLVICADILRRVQQPRYATLLLSRYQDGSAVDIANTTSTTRQAKNAAVKQAALLVQDILDPLCGRARSFNRQRTAKRTARRSKRDT